MNEAAILHQIKSKSSSSSLFETLQAYDHVIKLNQIQRTNPTALRVYEILIQQYGKIQQNNTRTYTSPRRRENVEDPELFSFSKQTKKDSSEFTTHLEKQQKNKYKSEGIRKIQHRQFVYPPNHPSQISQFKQYQIQNQNSKPHENDSYALQLKNKGTLRNFLLKKRWNEFYFELKKERKMRKNLLKNESTKYFREYKLIMKSFNIFVNVIKKKAENEQKASKFKEEKQNHLLCDNFSRWHSYAHRSEEQKERQSKILQNKAYLVKKLGLRKWIKNIKMFSQVQESELINEKEDVGNKYKILVWKVNIKKIHDRFQRNKEMKEKECLTKNNNMTTQLNVFMKLVRCSIQVQDMKMGKKINMCIKNRAHKLYSNLRKQKQFQEGYWTNTNKIVLIEYVFDAIVLKLQRQGYSYECMKKLPSLIQNHKSYPAYKKHKLKWYFHHLKEQIFNMRQKQRTVKYGIGKRILRKLAINYREKIKYSHIEHKANKISQQNAYLNTKEALFKLYKHGTWKRKENKVNQYVYHQKIVNTFRILQAYRMSKKYYEHQLYRFKVKKRQVNMETVFLQWKLLCHRQIHEKIVVCHYRKKHNKILVRNIFQILKTNSIEQKILKRKAKNLQKLFFYEKGQLMIKNLMKNSTVKPQNRMIKMKENRVSKIILGNRVRKLFNNCRYHKYKVIVQERVTQQYQHKLKYKILKALKCVQNYNKQENHKVSLIQHKVKNNYKALSLNSMISKLLANLTLRRMANIIKTQANIIGLQAIIYFSCQ